MDRVRNGQPSRLSSFSAPRPPEAVPSSVNEDLQVRLRKVGEIFDIGARRFLEAKAAQRLAPPEAPSKSSKPQ